MPENGSFDYSSVILPAGTVIGGYVLVDKVVGAQREKEFEHYKREMVKTTENLEDIIGNPEDYTRDDYQSEVAEYKPLVKATVEKVESDGINPSKIEDDLKGRSWRVKAITWKKTYLNLTAQAQMEIVGETRTERFIEGLKDTFPYLDDLIYIGITVGIMSKLADFGDGGGGLGQLKNFADWVKNGIVGVKDILEDVDIPEEDIPDSETPTSSPNPNTNPYVEGTARAAFAALGVATPIAMQLMNTVSFNPKDTLRIGEGALNAIANATGASVNFLVENPAVTIGLVIIAIALAITYADLIPGDEVIMTGIAAKYLATVGMTGVGITQLKEVGFGLQGDIRR